jgi:DHA1 family bicyclomycin/chloramphenicol resistance-like MFS transporter
MVAKGHEPDIAGARSARSIIAVLLLISPLDQIGFDIYAPALPLMSDEFGASNVVMQNTVTTYMLGMSLVVLPAGLLADSIGRKRILLGGLGLIALTSIGCALANSLTLLLILRFLQGLGGGICLLLAATIAADCFRGAKLVSVLGLLGAAWGAAPVLAPALGGVVVQVSSWRWVFVLLAALATAVALLAATMLPETLEVHRRTPVNLRSAAGVVAAALRNRLFVGFAVMFSLIAAAQSMFGVVAPFLYQDALGFEPAAYGGVALVVGVANLAGASACGALAQRTGIRTLGLVACALFALGAVVLVVSAATLGVNSWAIAVGGALAMLAIGVLDPLSKGMAMGVFTHNVGLITGLITTCCYLFITAGIALMAYLPESSSAPLGWTYLFVVTLFAAILLSSVSRGRQPA